MEPGITRPFSSGVHLLKTKLLYLFHNFDELNTKFCLLKSLGVITSLTPPPLARDLVFKITRATFQIIVCLQDDRLRDRPRTSRSSGTSAARPPGGRQLFSQIITSFRRRPPNDCDGRRRTHPADDRRGRLRARRGRPALTTAGGPPDDRRRFGNDVSTSSYLIILQMIFPTLFFSWDLVVHGKSGR